MGEQRSPKNACSQVTYAVHTSKQSNPVEKKAWHTASRNQPEIVSKEPLNKPCLTKEQSTGQSTAHQSAHSRHN